jgi:hypothetical protein
MYRYKSWSRFALVLPFAFAVACGGGDADRSALEEDELDRELDLALSGDSTPATFEDTAVATEEAPPPAAKPTRPRPRPPATQPEREPERTPPPVVTPPAPEPRTVTASVPVGTTMQLTLDETLSTETNKAGDAFTATLSSPIIDLDGDVLIPAGATVRGRVTQVQKSGRVGETAVLNLAFEAISFGERTYPLEASVVSANPERVGRSSTGEQVGKAAAGAAAGAILGRVLGKDTKSTIKGAVIGAAAGTAIAMGTADVDAVLKAGSTMVIKLDAPVTMTKTVTN